MKSLDLTAHPPRSPFEKLDGLLLLGRTIDKLRAELPGGKIGDYHFASMSETLCNELGIKHDDILAVVAEAADENEVAAWVRTHTPDPSRYEEINMRFLARRVDHSNRERLTKKYPVLANHTNEISIFELLDLDDNHQFSKA